MTESKQPSRIETFLYDADGNRTEEESVAVRGEVVELDAEGRVISRHAHDDLAWEVDPISLEGDPGELATRPKHEES
jgi:YD repeat-containing protein